MRVDKQVTYNDNDELILVRMAHPMNTANGLVLSEGVSLRTCSVRIEFEGLSSDTLFPILTTDDIRISGPIPKGYLVPCGWSAYSFM